jgi:hypothetical protein
LGGCFGGGSPVENVTKWTASLVQNVAKDKLQHSLKSAFCKAIAGYEASRKTKRQTLDDDFD